MPCCGFKLDENEVNKMYKLINLTKNEELFIIDKIGNSFRLKPGEEKITNSLPKDGFGNKLGIEEIKTEETKKATEPKKEKPRKED